MGQRTIHPAANRRLRTRYCDSTINVHIYVLLAGFIPANADISPISSPSFPFPVPHVLYP